MLKQIYVINGPNLNLLGTRETDIYGSQNLKDIEKSSMIEARKYKFNLKFFQSNEEGLIVDFIQEASREANGIIINAAGYTHTSIAILDALLAVKIPTIEVHITNIYRREDFREKSLISRGAIGIICGFGIKGYIMALDSIKEILS